MPIVCAIKGLAGGTSAVREVMLSPGARPRRRWIGMDYLGPARRAENRCPPRAKRRGFERRPRVGKAPIWAGSGMLRWAQYGAYESRADGPPRADSGGLSAVPRCLHL